MEDIGNLGIPDLHAAFARGDLSPSDLITELRRASEETEPTLNAFVSLFWDEALARASEMTRAPDPMPRLWGVPFAAKDNICYRGHETTCASRMLLGYKPPYTATALQRLQDAGALLVGKTNMDEFAMGSTGEFSYFGPTSNPINPDYVPGGSSSGSAAAVAAGLVPFALGSDTGGSVRQPAAWCGVVGFKPSYGRVSRYGLVAFASSMDQIGVISRNVRDSLLVFSVMAGHDPLDSTTSREPVPDPTDILSDYRGERFTIGLPKEYFGEGVDPKMAEAATEAARLLEREGHRIVDISLPHTRYVVPCYQILVAAECSSNLARFDGVRYGFRAEGYEGLEDMYTMTRTQGFGPEVKRRIAAGAFVLSGGYREEYFTRAQKVRRLIARDYEEAFSRVDALLSPTVPTFPVKKGEKLSDPLAIYAMDTLTSAANLAGLPGISLPWAPGPGGFRPGVHITTRFMDEATLFRIALGLEEVSFGGAHS